MYAVEPIAPKSRTTHLIRPAAFIPLVAVLALLLFGATLLATPTDASAAGAPLWVNDLAYGSAGGGFYWDGVSGQVWTAERGWHVYSPERLAPILWVNDLTYGSTGGGFYLDPASGWVWTAERGWHHYSPQPPRDSDGDGLTDPFDACPTQAGPITNNGCPQGPKDSDGDGILDPQDNCPNQAGPASNNGCPAPTVIDTDRDGVPDSQDYCPNQPGPVANHGCPNAFPPSGDADRDGVPDSQDYCPNTPGPAYNHGCPYGGQYDSDGDGVPDAIDHCPTQPGPSWNAGCPTVVGTVVVHVTVDRGTGSTYHVGEPIRVCYTVSMPFQIRITDVPSSGPQHTIISGFDDGTGGCINAFVTLPYGTEQIVISAIGGGGQVIATDQTSFNVIP